MTQHDPDSDAMKLAAIKRYGWYAMTALRYRIGVMQKAVDTAKQSQIDDVLHCVAVEVVLCHLKSPFD